WKIYQFPKGTLFGSQTQLLIISRCAIEFSMHGFFNHILSGLSYMVYAKIYAFGVGIGQKV
ncbi:MAG: hypothetical protein KDK69_02665, partial [Chlamydiia bacterium]|nr:hypothetical protein [Chlamydiia bacterium]